jgi:type II secretory pathway predicted ATPase ExeA
MPMPQLDAAAFRLTPDLRFLFSQAVQEAAFTQLLGGIRRGARLLIVTGEIGTGKTLLLRRLESELTRDGVIAVYLGLPDLLTGLGTEFESAPSPDGTHLPVAEIPAKNRVVILDDADRCSDHRLQDLYKLTLATQDDSPSIQTILAGSPALASRLTSGLPELGKLIGVHAQLAAFNRPEVDAYIRHRLDVSGKYNVDLATDALSAVFRYSRGIPRLVNHVCARTLLLAGTGRRQISHEIAQEAIDDWVAIASFGQLPSAKIPEPLRVETVPVIKAAEPTCVGLDDQPKPGDAPTSDPVTGERWQVTGIGLVDAVDELRSTHDAIVETTILSRGTSTARRPPSGLQAPDQGVVADRSEIATIEHGSPKPSQPPNMPNIRSHARRPRAEQLQRGVGFRPNDLVCLTNPTDAFPHFSGFRPRRTAKEADTTKALRLDGASSRIPAPTRSAARMALFASACTAVVLMGIHFHQQPLGPTDLTSLRDAIVLILTDARVVIHDRVLEFLHEIGKLIRVD